MSNVDTETCHIGQIHEGLLTETLELLRAVTDGLRIAPNGEVTSDGGYQHTACDLALYTPKLPQGLGLNFRNRPQLEIVGDRYGEEFASLRNQVVQTYQVLAGREALRLMGYDVDQPQVVAGDRYNLYRQVAVHA